MLYTIVLLNGKEASGLTPDGIKELFLRRQVNQNSLLFSDGDPSWRMLKREFDPRQWIGSAIQNAACPAPAEPVQPQDLPPTDAKLPDNGISDGRGHTQNNQSQTYYQAETLPSEAKLQNIKSNYAPTAVRAEPDYSSSVVGERTGLRPAAVFLIGGVLLYLPLVFIAGFVPGADSAEAVGQTLGRVALPILIDLFLAWRLWRGREADSARKWVLVRSYVGFAAGLIMPFTVSTGLAAFIGVLFGLLGFFYLLAVALVLHGRNSPSPGRVYAAVGSFSMFAIATIAVIGIAAIGAALPSLAKMNLNAPEIEKYKIDGNEFRDKTTGATVSIPEGWVMLSTSNPIVNTPTARMIAVDREGERISMLEVVPVPAELDIKRQAPAVILDRLSDNVIAGMAEEARNGSVFGKNIVREMSRIATYVGKHPAKLVIVEKTEFGRRVKGHIVITYDELTFYVLHSWCPAEDYTRSQGDFEHFERSFTVPESINSVFTQTAENERRAR
jgi:hypothetical protein